MTFPTPLDKPEELDQIFVERKLSGVYATIPVEVSYKTFTDLIESMQEVLSDEFDIEHYDHDEFDVNRIAQNPAFIKYFEYELNKFLTRSDWDIGDAWSDTGRVFNVEIKRIRNEQAQKEAERLASYQAQMHEAATRGQAIVVAGEENFQKARAILLAAGLIQQ